MLKETFLADQTPIEPSTCITRKYLLAFPGQAWRQASKMICVRKNKPLHILSILAPGYFEQPWDHGPVDHKRKELIDLPGLLGEKKNPKKRLKGCKSVDIWSRLVLEEEGV